jgi:hypothetical protein
LFPGFTFSTLLEELLVFTQSPKVRDFISQSERYYSTYVEFSLEISQNEMTDTSKQLIWLLCKFLQEIEKLNQTGKQEVLAQCNQ